MSDEYVLLMMQILFSPLRALDSTGLGTGTGNGRPQHTDQGSVVYYTVIRILLLYLQLMMVLLWVLPPSPPLRLVIMNLHASFADNQMLVVATCETYKTFSASRELSSHSPSLHPSNHRCNASFPIQSLTLYVVRFKNMLQCPAVESMVVLFLLLQLSLSSADWLTECRHTYLAMMVVAGGGFCRVVVSLHCTDGFDIKRNVNAHCSWRPLNGD